MATVNDTVRTAILHYPTLFSSRRDVLHHLFCVNGNGYEWEDGELVDFFDNSEPWTPEDVERFPDFELFEPENPANDEANAFFTKMNEERHEKHDAYVADLTRIVTNVDTVMFDMETGRESIYPQCSYAQLFNIPSDVKPDWAAAAEEIKPWATSQGWIL